MNILEKRKVKTEGDDIIKNVEVFDTKLKLAGSASLRSMMYYSDYDFNCKLVSENKHRFLMNSNVYYRFRMINCIL